MGNYKDSSQAPAEGKFIACNYVKLSGTIKSDIEYIKCKSGSHVAVFDFHYHSSSEEPGTMQVVAYENVGAFCHQHLRTDSLITIQTGNLNEYKGKQQVIANSIDLFDDAGKLVNSVKKVSHKGWAAPANPDKATGPKNPAGEASNDLLERVAKLEKMVSDAGKSREK